MKNKHLFIAFSILFTTVSCSPSSENESQDASIEANNSSTTETIGKYEEIGLEYASSTQQVLGKNLIQAMGEGGVSHALSFCNIHALSLTDSMSQQHNAFIKRVSDLPRNPNNQANAKELEEIDYFKKLISEGKSGTEIQPNINIKGNQVHFYSPILTHEMCLTCHGSKDKDVSPETIAALSTLYPNDKALDYNSNEVRGIWSIVFEK